MRLSLLIDRLRQGFAGNAHADRVPKLINPAPRIGDPEISSVHYHAQTVAPGGLFVAIRGYSADGHDYIDTAIARGAAAVLVEKDISAPVAVLQVADTRAALAHTAAAFYGQPDQDLTMIGITGTNGKTTTAYLIEQILQAAGCRVGVIGTINYRYDGQQFDNPVTTPESLDLFRILAAMHRSGVTHVVMEVSSHALALGRVERLGFDVAVFTSLSQDHLDFHGNMAHYWQSKKRLFTELLGKGAKNGSARAVVNHDDPKGRKLSEILKQPIVAVGRNHNNAVSVASAQITLEGIDAELGLPEGRIKIHSGLIGRHNLENILCAAGVGAALGIANDRVADGIAKLASVPGRLEPVINPYGIFTYVDYAHTPDALDNALKTLRQLARRRLICVFGCGGDRDRDKRPQMGAIAMRYSDLALVTSDNPRTENPDDIIADILEGMPAAQAKRYPTSSLSTGYSAPAVAVDPDRRAAISAAVAAARPGDTVLIAGKGHETYQIIGKRTVDFDDRVAADLALTAVHGRDRNKRT